MHVLPSFWWLAHPRNRQKDRACWFLICEDRLRLAYTLGRAQSPGAKQAAAFQYRTSLSQTPWSNEEVPWHSRWQNALHKYSDVPRNHSSPSLHRPQWLTRWSCMRAGEEAENGQLCTGRKRHIVTKKKKKIQDELPFYFKLDKSMLRSTHDL